jgi:hypothetical protein
MPIRIFVTGGTVDKEYNELNGQLFFGDTHLPEMLSRSRHTLDVSVETLMMIDSLLMTQEDRDLIAAECRKAKEDRIVITHATDTMPRDGQSPARPGPQKNNCADRRYDPLYLRQLGRLLQPGLLPCFCANAAGRRLCRDERAVFPGGYGQEGHGDGKV